jgi:transcription elongation GreA/GreB family factor
LSVASNTAKFLQGLKVGDAVNVWVSGKTITKIIKVF